MYKRLGWMNYTDFNPDSIPKSVDELKCELYPKNAEQIWNEYQRAKTENTWYDDDEVCDAIERTHDIAHHVIGDVKFDKSPKYPVKVTMKGGDPFTILLEKSLAGLKKKNLHKKKEYVDRLRHELEVIQKLDNSPYFVLMERVIQLAKTVTLVGVGRGSSGGSLVAYCLGITDIDPIKYECRFDRFQNVHRCLDPDTIVRTEHGDVKIKDLNIGDLIFDSNHILQNVTAKFNTTTSSIIKFTLGDQIIICSENHLWPIVRNGEKLIVKANEVTIFDELIYERDTETV
jgi:hypothetical protein